MAALAAVQYGAIPILVDILEQRLEYAKSLGIEHIVNPHKEDDIKRIKEITSGRMAEVVMEASGANISIKILCIIPPCRKNCFNRMAKNRNSITNKFNYL